MTLSRISTLRTARGLTMAELAATVGTSKSHIWALEHGRYSPGAALLGRIAQTLGVTSEYLLGIEHDLADAEDEAFFRSYLAMPQETRARVRAVVEVMGRGDTNLNFTPEEIEALEAEGWTPSALYDDAAWFEQGGYKLHVYSLDHKRYGSVKPVECRTDPKWDLVPAIKGRGAKARIAESVRELEERHRPYLNALDIELSEVGVKQWVSSGRGGDYLVKSISPRRVLTH